jgi:hypothetical protein
MSDGAASYYFDLTDKYFLKPFETEINAAWNAALAIKEDAFPSPYADKEEKPRDNEKYINFVQFDEFVK